MKFIKDNIKFISGLIVGLSIASVSAAVLISANEVTFTSSNTKWTDTDVSTALDTLYDKSSYGDASSSDILTGKTALVAGSKVSGGMLDNGAVSQILDTTTTTYTIPAGYHNGSGTVSLSTQTKTATPSTSTQTITPDAGSVLSSVTVSAVSATKTLGSTNGTKVDMGGAYRYVNTNAVYNAGYSAGSSGITSKISSSTVTVSATKSASTDSSGTSRTATSPFTNTIGAAIYSYTSTGGRACTDSISLSLSGNTATVSWSSRHENQSGTDTVVIIFYGYN